MCGLLFVFLSCHGKDKQDLFFFFFLIFFTKLPVTSCFVDFFHLKEITLDFNHSLNGTALTMLLMISCPFQ